MELKQNQEINKQMTITSGLVDFHCHLDLYPDHAEIVERVDKACIFTLAVTTTPRAWPQNHELTKHTKYVRAALGLHPQLVSDYSFEIELWDRYFPEARYIGEVGLDAGPRYYKSIDIQKRVFQHILEKCAESGDKILTVHSARAVKVVLDYLESYLLPDKGKVVLHWFTGSKNEAKRALSLGCYFSINTSMLTNERHLAMVREIPLDRILTETDGPFTQINGKPSMPKDVISAVNILASLHNITSEQVVRAIQHNLRHLVS